METDTIQTVAQGINWNLVGLYVVVGIVVLGIAWTLINYLKKKR